VKNSIAVYFAKPLLPATIEWFAIVRQCLVGLVKLDLPRQPALLIFIPGSLLLPLGNSNPAKISTLVP